MSKVYGYCRISTRKQKIERQIENIISAYPEAAGNIYQEAFTGTKIYGRKEWEKLYKRVKPGDYIIFDEVSRMSRNADEGFKLYQELYNKEVNLVFLKEPHINTETYKQALQSRQNLEVKTGDQDADDLINQIMSAVSSYMFRLTEKQIQLAFNQAEKEVNYLRMRTKEGLRVARDSGAHLGHYTGQKITTKKQTEAAEVIREHSRDFGGSLKDADCMKLAGISRNSFYKYKKQLAEELSRAE